MHVSDVVLSLSGVAIIVALVWWAMGSALARIGDERDARARIAAEHPNFVVGQLTIGADGQSALALSQDDREAVLLFTLGRRLVCWRLPRARLRAELVPGGGGPDALLVHTGDFTRPSFRLILPDRERGQALLVELQGRPVERAAP
jgi:hypothetical protein